MAYATNDIDRAKAFLRDRLGITDFEGLGGGLPEGGEIRAELAWVGPIMYELISASGPGSTLYVGRLPQDGGFHIRHHHLGFLIHDEGQWDDAMDEAVRNNWPMLRSSSNPLVRSCFVDVVELGHYLELLLPTDAGLDFFNNVPRS